MADCGEHCPFLNRADARCAEHFSLDALGHAFEFCFDRYKACPVYVEMLVERRLRQGISPVVHQPIKIGASNAAHRLLQVTISDRYAKSLA